MGNEADETPDLGGRLVDHLLVTLSLVEQRLADLHAEFVDELLLIPDSLERCHAWVFAIVDVTMAGFGISLPWGPDEQVVVADINQLIRTFATESALILGTKCGRVVEFPQPCSETVLRRLGQVGKKSGEVMVQVQKTREGMEFKLTPTANPASATSAGQLRSERP